MQPEPARTLALVVDVHSGDPWHGYSTHRILAGISPETAAARPGHGAHSIWEIVLHMTSWTREVASRLEGHEPKEPAAGDWPPTGDTTPERWRAALADLDASQREVADAAARVPDGRWDERFGRRDAALGTGKTYRETLEGLAVHHGYHAGQIAVLKRILGAA